MRLVIWDRYEKILQLETNLTSFPISQTGRGSPSEVTDALTIDEVILREPVRSRIHFHLGWFVIPFC